MNIVESPSPSKMQWKNRVSLAGSLRKIREKDAAPEKDKYSGNTYEMSSM